jgi:thiol-disulfide isomerase/thioredoxin
VTPELQKLYEQLQEIDKRLPGPTATRKDHERFNIDRADLIENICRAVKSAEDYATWTRQLADHIAITVQIGTFPEGLARLTALESEVKKSAGPMSELLAYVMYRRLNTHFTTELQKADTTKRQQIQADWMKELEEFVKTFPKADESADAAFQIAMNHEFAGNIDDAIKWYKQVALKWPKTEKGQSAAGALHRLELKGKEINLGGPRLGGGQVSLNAFKGKVVVVQFWATWCKTCTEDLPQLKALYQEFRGKPFEIVGVNLDETADTQSIQAYLTQHGVPWTQIVQQQGQRGPIATGLGLVSLPTMLLIDQKGVVVNRGAAVADLKTEVPELLGIKKKDTVKPAGGTK